MPVDGWVEAIALWLVWLRAAGRPNTTLALRAYQVRRLAAAMEPAGPWQVSADDLVGWLGDQGWSRNTLRSYRSAIRGFYRWAHGSGLIPVDPALGLPYVSERPPRPRPTPEAAYRQALARGDDRLRLMLRLAAELGLRRGEVAQVHRDDLERDLVGWTLLVHGKGGRTRRVPVTSPLATAIATQACVDLDGGGWVFPSRYHGGHLSAQYVGKLVALALPAGWSMHTLRHRFGTLAYSVDRDLFTVQGLLGHASADTTRRYVLVPDDAARETVTAVAQLGRRRLPGGDEPGRDAARAGGRAGELQVEPAAG